MQIHGSKGKFNLKCGIATDFHRYDDSTKSRYTVKLDSGELTILNLDHYTLIEDLTDPGDTPASRNPTEVELDDRHRP